MENEIVFEKATFSYKEGILFCKLFNDDTHHKLQEVSVANYIDAMVKLSKGKRSPVIIDLRNCKGTYTITAAKLLSKTKKFEDIRLVEAYLINSMSSQLLVNSYKRIYDQSVPYKVFEEMDAALTYCNEIKNA